MRCFEHREREAIGVCRACGRGACEACVIAGGELACSDACRARLDEAASTRARELSLMLRSEHLLERTNNNRGITRALYVGLGGVVAAPSLLFALLHLLGGDLFAALPLLGLALPGILMIRFGLTGTRGRI